jgi:hypothetical protein
MEQKQLEAVEKELFEERGVHFRGTARIRFENLNFGSLGGRMLDRKIVNYLKDRFKTAGCLRIPPGNRIPAIINQKVLDDAIQNSPGLSSDSLVENAEEIPPELELPAEIVIECLQGMHRVAAGKEILEPEDWWWTVDLYLEGAITFLRNTIDTNDLYTDASLTLRRALSEEYSDYVNFSDGEIYFKLRQLHYDPDKQNGTLYAEKRILGRLSKDKRKDLKRILKNFTLRTAFDKLLNLPGLWRGFRIDHKLLLDLKYFEVRIPECFSVFFPRQLADMGTRRFRITQDASYGAGRKFMVTIRSL